MRGRGGEGIVYFVSLVCFYCRIVLKSLDWSYPIPSHLISSHIAWDELFESVTLVFVLSRVSLLSLKKREGGGR